MEKTAKIKSLKFKNEFEGKYGKLFAHEIELDNGDKGEILAKTQEPDKLRPGSELTYTLESREYNGNTYFTIKAVNKKDGAPLGGGRKATTGGAASFALSYAKDIHVALISAGRHTAMDAEPVMAAADKFYNWLKSKES